MFYSNEIGEQCGPLILNKELNILFGANGAGKTRTLNIISHLSVQHRKQKVKYSGNHNIIIRNGDEKYIYDLNLKKVDKGLIVTQDNLYAGKEKRIIFDRKKNLLLNEVTNELERYSPIDDELSFNYVKDTEKYRTVLMINDYLRRYKRLDSFVSGDYFTNLPVDIITVSPQGIGIDTVLLNVMRKYPKIFEDIKDNFVDIYPQIEDIIKGDIIFEPRTLQETIFLKEKGIQKEYHYLHAASGMIRVLTILSLLFSPEENSLILIDELENSLDYESLRKIIEIIKDIGSETQMIIVTHSPIVADMFSLEDWIIVKREGLKVKYFNVREDEDLRDLRKRNIENYSLYSQDLLTLDEHK